MSVAEFSQTLRDRIFSRFTGLKTRDNREEYKKLVDSEKFRAKYETAKKGASSEISASSLNKLKNDLVRDIEDDTLKSSTERFLKSIDFNSFVAYLKTTKYVQDLIETNPGEFRLQSVPQAVLRDQFLNYIELQLAIFGFNPVIEASIFDHITKNIQSGHLAGVFTLRLKEALFIDVKQTGQGYRDFTLDLGEGVDKGSIDTLERIMKVILDADYLTSNIVDKEHIFAKATKSVLGNSPHLEVELQYSKDNEAAGKLLKDAGSGLNDLIKAISSNLTSKDTAASDGFRKLVISLKPLTELVLAKAAELRATPSGKDLADQIAGDARSLSLLASSLVNTKGSPSMVESVSKNIANIIKHGKVLEQVTTTITSKASKSSKDSDVQNINKTLKQVAGALKQLQAEVKKQNKASGQKASRQIVPKLQGMPSLTSLQDLINRNLQNVISANMGDGSDNKVLNYKTGRFAGSAKVEHLSKSRAGMITAFYSYMKNPYQTFEPGFKQGTPKSRDPKLLIAKSIREIAATKVADKLRAQAL